MWFCSCFNKKIIIDNSEEIKRRNLTLHGRGLKKYVQKFAVSSKLSANFQTFTFIEIYPEFTRPDLKIRQFQIQQILSPHFLCLEQKLQSRSAEQFLRVALLKSFKKSANFCNLVVLHVCLQKYGARKFGELKWHNFVY